MKRLHNYLLLALVCCAGAFAACSKDDEGNPNPAKDPSIVISDVVANMESITFKLTPADADAYEYGCATRADFEAGSYELTRVDNGEPSAAITIDGLEPETEYAIIARAYFGDKQGALVNQFATTLAAPAVAPVLTIADVKAQANSVAFVISHEGDAASYFYAVYPKDGEAPETFTEVAVAEQGATSVTVDNLFDGTAYVIEAYGKYGDLEGEHAKAEFTTVKLAVSASISDITDSDAKLTVTMDKELCAEYFIGIYDASNPIADADIIMSVQSTTDGKQAEPLETLLSESGLLAGMTITPNTEYVVWWVMLDADKANDEDELAALTPDAVHTISFKTLPLDMTGTASVSMALEKVSVQSATVKFTPNANTAKYIYSRFYKSDFEANYKTDDQIASYLLVNGMKVDGNAEQSIKFDYLEAKTGYVVCAIAVDAEGKYGTPTQFAFDTPDFDFSSPVTFEMTKLDFSNPQETAQFQIVGDLSNVAEIRYINMSQTEYRRDYLGKPENVQAKMLANMTPTKTITPQELSRQRMPLESGLESAATYYYFVMMMDKDGKFTTMSQTEYKTEKYDLTGVAAATWTLGEHTISQSGSGDKVTTFMDFKLDVQPNSECQEMWILVIDESTMKTTPDKTLILRAKTQGDNAQGWTSKGTAAWTTAETRIFLNATSDKYFVIPVCVDKDGKYNNIREDALEITAPEGELPTPGGDGSDAGSGDPKL